MLADLPRANVDAACQVAHALSTHRTELEMDYFTAVDDLAPGDEPGAGMIGTIEYNSACFYRFSVIDWGKLLDNLPSDGTVVGPLEFPLQVLGQSQPPALGHWFSLCVTSDLSDYFVDLGPVAVRQHRDICLRGGRAVDRP